MGWFGFNAGSALQSGSVATSAVASTQIAACTSGLVWLVISWIRNKPSTIALINGVIAGLAGITPASGYISSQATLLVGLILGLASYFSVILVKHKLRIDDALDVSSGTFTFYNSIYLSSWTYWNHWISNDWCFQ
jgi:Amt family ammonium transporter